MVLLVSKSAKITNIKIRGHVDNFRFLVLEKTINKQNSLIEEQKKQLEEQKKQLEEQRKQIVDLVEIVKLLKSAGKEGQEPNNNHFDDGEA